MRVEYISMAKGPEESPPGASVPTPQLTIFGLMVKLDTWWATESSVYMPTAVPGMAASSSRRLAPAAWGRSAPGPAGPVTATGPMAAATARAGTTRRAERRRRAVRVAGVVATAPDFLLGPGRGRP